MAKKRRRARRAFKASGLFSLIIAAVLMLITKGAYNALLSSEYFTVKEVEILRVEVEEDSRIADPNVRLQLEEGINIFKLDLKRCKQQIEQRHPEIKNVKVNRVLPDKIVVLFEKRKPICQVKSNRLFLVGEDAVVLPDSENYAEEGLITVAGIYISESQLPPDRKIHSGAIHRILRLIKQIEQTNFSKRYKVEKIDAYDELNPVICLEDGIQIKVGKRNFIKMEPALSQVLEDLESKGLKPKSIDLRFDDIVVTPR